MFRVEAGSGSTPAAAARHTLRQLAKRILHLAEEINDLTTQITLAIPACAPKLLDRYGVGPDTAATLLIAAGDNPERMASEASFVTLEAVTGKPTARSTPSSWPAFAGAPCTGAYLERRVTEARRATKPSDV
ncbi:hypothetical protein [Streptomyces sp. LN590]|uniref:hypothetical protein n=1 Tax=unclassified Streptomyces TaxID=2593676 RepID=UPI003720A4F7